MLTAHTYLRACITDMGIVPGTNGPSRRQSGPAWTTKRRYVRLGTFRCCLATCSRILCCWSTTVTITGKSCLLDRYISGIFEGQPKNTIGAAFAAKKVCAVLPAQMWLAQAACARKVIAAPMMYMHLCCTSALLYRQLLSHAAAACRSDCKMSG